MPTALPSPTQTARPLVQARRRRGGAGNPRTSVPWVLGVGLPGCGPSISCRLRPPSPLPLVSSEPTQRYPGPRRGLNMRGKSFLVTNCCVIRCCDASKMIRWCVESFSLWHTHPLGMSFPRYQFDCFFRNLSFDN